MLSAEIRSATANPLNIPVDDCVFSILIGTPRTCGSTLTNHAGIPLNCTRTLANYMNTLLNCMRILPNCKRMFANYIAKIPNKIAQISAIGGQSLDFLPILPGFRATTDLTHLTANTVQRSADKIRTASGSDQPKKPR
jgi:hypothetical protein